MNVTLSLHDKNLVQRGVIEENVRAKNPIIFVVAEEDDASIFQIVNTCEMFRKNNLLLNRFDLARSFAFLVSFSDLTNKDILIVAPNRQKNDAIKFSRSLIQLIKERINSLSKAKKGEARTPHVTDKFNDSVIG